MIQDGNGMSEKDINDKMNDLRGSRQLDLLATHELLEKAMVLFGDIEAARRWYFESCPGLGGKSPLDCCKTAVGRKQVGDLLDSMREGTF